MTDREKVVKGLEAHATGSGCMKNCPYWGIETLNCSRELATEALALLKEQEPRVLALDEIHRGMVVWLEDKDKPDTILAIGGASAGKAKCFITVDDTSVRARDDEYNVRWRAWTFEPTDEQRQAVKWE